MPQISREVPDSIEITFERPAGQARTSVILAEAMLKAGMLRGDDWKGTLGETMQAGWARWLTELGVDDMKVIDMCFLYTDNIHELGVRSDTRWRMQFGVPNDYTSGALTLMLGRHVTVEVEERIAFFESVQPGAGYNMLAMVCSYLYGLTGAVTPRWCLERAKGDDFALQKLQFEASIGRGELNDPEARAAAAAQVVSEENFLSTVPKDACRGLDEIDIQPLRKAWRKLDGRDQASADVLDLALDLHEHFKKTCDILDAGDHYHVLDFGSGEIPQGKTRLRIPNWKLTPVTIRWNDRDLIGRIADAFHYSVLNAGLGVNSIYTQAFGFTQPANNGGSIAKAIENMGATIRMLVLCDRLLQTLRSTEAAARCGERDDRLNDMRKTVGLLMMQQQQVEQQRVREREAILSQIGGAVGDEGEDMSALWVDMADFMPDLGDEYGEEA